MRHSVLLLALATAGCGPDYKWGTDVDPSGADFPRPHEPVTQIDRILQATQPKVDVLWVVDNSCSMDFEQKALTDNFPAFFEFFEGSGLDYHIGVVSTDMDWAPPWKGQLVTKRGERFITPETPEAAKLFKEMALLGTSGSGTERGIDATYAALETERNAHNVGFLRDESSVHVIAVSDEGDYSMDITADELASYLDGLRADPDDVTFSSIVTPEQPCEQAWEHGAAYVAVTRQVGGIYWSICNEDWQDVLRQLGLQAAGLKREYFLSQLPVPGTIAVHVEEQGNRYSFTEGDDWAYNASRNSITFHTFVPEPMSEVILEYQILSSHHGD